jgi:hypothetical protein
MRNSIPFLFLILALFAACKSSNEIDNVAPANGLAYFPLVVGATKIYSLDSITFKPISGTNIKKDTFNLSLKEVITDTFRDQIGVLAYRIERYKRSSDALPWNLVNVAKVSINNQNILRTDNNLTFVKCPLYMSEKQRWGGDAFIDSTIVIEIAGETMELISKSHWSWTYEVTSLDKAETIGNKAFSTVATLTSQISPNILTEKRYSLEKYAKGVGLIYKEQKILDSQNNNTALTWEQRGQKGYILKQTIVSY